MISLLNFRKNTQFQIIFKVQMFDRNSSKKLQTYFFLEVEKEKWKMENFFEFNTFLSHS